MTGADYVDQKITLPLRWVLIFATLAAIPLAWTARYLKVLYIVGGFFLLQLLVPPIVRAVYVRPNEISIERPYIERHIAATTSAFALDRNTSGAPVRFLRRPPAGRPPTRRRTPPCWPTYGCGICAPTTPPSGRSRRCGPITRFRTPTWTATSSTAASGRCWCRARDGRHAAFGRGQPELDQSALHLHARLRRGGVRSQPNYARRLAGTSDQGRAAGDLLARFPAHAPGDLLRRETQEPVFVHTLGRSSIIPPVTRISIRRMKAAGVSRSTPSR